MNVLVLCYQPVVLLMEVLWRWSYPQTLRPLRQAYSNWIRPSPWWSLKPRNKQLVYNDNNGVDILQEAEPYVTEPGS